MCLHEIAEEQLELGLTLVRKIIETFRYGRLSYITEKSFSFCRSYLGVTCHWIDAETLQRHSAAIACRRLKGSHTYKLLASTLEDIHKEFKIQNKVERTVTDNGSNFCKAFRCACHTLNLIASKDVEAAESDKTFKAVSRAAFGKCQAIFNKQSRSSLASDTVKEKLGRLLVVPNSTRWNSVYQALECITSLEEKQEGIFDALCDTLEMPSFQGSSDESEHRSSEEDNDEKGFFDSLATVGKTTSINEADRFIAQEPTSTASMLDQRFLKPLFIKYNTALPASAAVERLFSIGGQIFVPNRANISDANFERQLLLKVNKGLITYL
ncbi:hypothetical protein HOLleu_43801 [Holothuria leucospilota]|uniref:Transposase n=1 Tax=Holothuria leucospilota TaxID=206669 RepID=A0A9Q0YDC1_HOLLE|nr:hypothetical protein HOLleu_43801 [Holothuria leucospilota]